MKIVRWGLLFSLLSVIGCSGGRLKNSSVKDTPKNREIYNLVHKYRLAMENRDMQTLRRMVSRDYFENASSTDDSKDDYGFEKLVTKVIPLLRNNVKRLRYVVYVRKINFKGDSTASAEYEFLVRMQITEGGKSTWKVKNDFNRLDFSKEKGEWKIVGGL
ncbi:MAG: nuclear transport factor 2 family protein [Myxococcales bacterium]|nr:nuclear transport factor 2 family protein [Myxococcales bacterium]